MFDFIEQGLFREAMDNITNENYKNREIEDSAFSSNSFVLGNSMYINYLIMIWFKGINIPHVYTYRTTEWELIN